MAFGEILALDISSSMTGIVRGEPGKIPEVRSRSFHWDGGGTSEEKMNMAFAMMTNWVMAEFDVGTRPLPAAVAIEASIPQGAGLANTHYEAQLVLLGLQAIVRGEATRHSIPVKMVHGGTWKKFVLGNGSLPSAKAKTLGYRVCADLGIPVKNTDESDGACIWLWACDAIAKHRDDRLLPLMARAAIRNRR